MVIELLRKVRVLNPLTGMDEVADVQVVDGRIEAIAPTLDEPIPSADATGDVHIIDQPGLVLGPGLVDLYSHSGEPGYESRETLDSLAQAALAGGFSRLTLLPDTQPVLDHAMALEQIRQLTQRLEAAPQVHCWGALTQGVKGELMAELAELAAAGAVGFADGQPIQHPVLQRRLLEYAQFLDKPVALWPCDRQLTGGGVAREGPVSIQLGLVGAPTMAETAALAALLECVAATQTPVHLMRLSTARSVELLAAARQQGLRITASVSWMHLLLTVDDLADYNPNLRLEPPLGTSEDREALVQAVREGVIEAIAIDHSPYTYEEKTVAFAEAPAGAIGLELALPLLWSRLVETGQWRPLGLWRALSLNPAHILNQPPPNLVVGEVAEMVLFDPQAPWTVSPATLKSRSTNTPWLGQAIQGKVLKTWTGRPTPAATGLTAD